MRTSRGSSLWKRLAQVLSIVLCLAFVGAPVAMAEDARQSEDGGAVGAAGTQLTPEQKNQLLEAMKTTASESICDKSAAKDLIHAVPGGPGLCSGFVKGMVKDDNPDQAAAKITAEAVCRAIPLAPQEPCKVALGDLTGVAKDLAIAHAKFLAGIAKNVEQAAKIAKFISNPAGGIDDAANTAKKDAVGMSSALLRVMTQTTSFDPSAGWFLKTWAAGAGIGLVIFAISVVFTLIGAEKGKYSLEDARDGITRYGPFAMLGLFFGPAVGMGISGIVDNISLGIGDWAGKPLDGFLQMITDIARLTSNEFMGSMTGLILFTLLILGSLGSFGNLIVQELGVNMTGVMISLVLGLLIHPVWRKRVYKVLGMFGSILATKPALFFLMGVVFMMAGSVKPLSGDPSKDLQTFVTLLMVALSLLTLTLAPWAMLKWMPILQPPSGGHVQGTVHGAAAGAAAGTAMSMFTNNMMNKANSKAKEDRSTKNTSSNNQGTSTNNSSSQGKSSTSSQKSQSPGNPSEKTGAAGKSAASKTGATGGATGAGGAGGGAGGAAGGASGGAGAAGAAGAAAAPLLVMQAAMAAAQAAKAKAHEHANSAVHDLRTE